MNLNLNIKHLKKIYRLQYIRIDTNYIYIKSRFDAWLIIITENGLELRHRNRYGNTNDYHKQKTFNSIHSTLKYIKRHDNYRISYKETRMDRLFASIS